MNTMPWGKFRGYLFTQIPSSYLLWLIENSTDQAIVEIAKMEYYKREEEDRHWENDYYNLEEETIWR